MQRFVTNPQAIGSARTKVLDEDIGALEQLQAEFFSSGGFQIEHETFFVAVEMSKIETKCRIGSEIPVRIALRRRFNLDHPRPEISQKRSRIGAGDEGRAFDHHDVVENFDGHLSPANLPRITP